MTETFRQDARNAMRVLIRSRGFAVAAVIMLALGIGANTAIFSVMRASSLRGSPLPDPDRLAIIWTTPAGDPQSNEGARIIEYFAWRDQNRTFDAVGTMLGWQSTVDSERNGEPAERLSGARFSASAFRALAVQPQLGRFFAPNEDTVGFGDGVVVISDRLWRTRFSADPAVLGRTLVTRWRAQRDRGGDAAWLWCLRHGSGFLAAELVQPVSSTGTWNEPGPDDHWTHEIGCVHRARSIRHRGCRSQASPGRSRAAERAGYSPPTAGECVVRQPAAHLDRVTRRRRVRAPHRVRQCGGITACPRHRKAERSGRSGLRSARARLGSFGSS